MSRSLFSEVYFLFFTSTHVAYSAPEYSIWLAFISLISMPFKVLENRDYALFIFVFLRPRTMSCTKIMLKIRELKKYGIWDHFPLCPFGMLQFVWYWHSSDSLLLDWCKINYSFTLLKFATWYWNTCGYIIHHFHAHFLFYFFSNGLLVAACYIYFRLWKWC